MNRTYASERLAISFPIIVALFGLVGWVIQSMSKNRHDEAPS
jgi:hypothetical protein